MAISRHPFFQMRKQGWRREEVTCLMKLRESEAKLVVDPKGRALAWGIGLDSEPGLLHLSWAGGELFPPCWSSLSWINRNLVSRCGKRLIYSCIKTIVGALWGIVGGGGRGIQDLRGAHIMYRVHLEKSEVRWCRKLKSWHVDNNQ